MKFRLAVFFVFMGIFSLVYSAGATVEVSQQDAEMLMKQFKDLVGNIDGFGIFSHNTTLAIPMFIPGLGMVWGLFSAFSTGWAFSAISVIHPDLANESPLSILYFSPFGIMELVAYSLGISRSYMVLRTIMKKCSLKPHLIPLAVEVGIVVGLLLAGGYLEFYLIEVALETKMISS